MAHGKFGKWLESVKIDWNVANRFVKITEKLGVNSDTYQNIGTNALYLIATMPEEARELPHVGPDRETAFDSGGNNARIRVWIHGSGTFVENYLHESGDWALTYNQTKELTRYYERSKEDEEKTQQRLENIQKAAANYEQIFAAVLISE